jgi:hypothetical protein
MPLPIRSNHSVFVPAGSNRHATLVSTGKPKGLIVSGIRNPKLEFDSATRTSKYTGFEMKRQTANPEVFTMVQRAFAFALNRTTRKPSPVKADPLTEERLVRLNVKDSATPVRPLNSALRTNPATKANVRMAKALSRFEKKATLARANLNRAFDGNRLLLGYFQGCSVQPTHSRSASRNRLCSSGSLLSVSAVLDWRAR